MLAAAVLATLPAAAAEAPDQPWAVQPCPWPYDTTIWIGPVLVCLDLCPDEFVEPSCIPEVA